MLLKVHKAMHIFTHLHIYCPYNTENSMSKILFRGKPLKFCIFSQITCIVGGVLYKQFYLYKETKYFFNFLSVLLFQNKVCNKFIYFSQFVHFWTYCFLCSKGSIMSYILYRSYMQYMQVQLKVSEKRYWECCCGQSFKQLRCDKPPVAIVQDGKH